MAVFCEPSRVCCSKTPRIDHSVETNNYSYFPRMLELEQSCSGEINSFRRDIYSVDTETSIGNAMVGIPYRLIPAFEFQLASFEPVNYKKMQDKLPRAKVR